MNVYLTILLTFLQLNFEGSDFDTAIKQRFSYQNMFSIEEKKEFCERGNRYSCILYFLETFKDSDKNPEELLTIAETYFNMEDQDIAIYTVLKKYWQKIPHDVFSAHLQNAPEIFKKRLRPLYLHKLYIEGRIEQFLVEYVPTNDEELAYLYVSELIKKDVVEAFGIIRALPYHFSEEFFDKVDKLLAGYRRVLWKKNLAREYNIWLLRKNYQHIRYKKCIRLVNRWFPAKDFKDIHDWRAHLLKAMSYTRRREHSKAVIVYRHIGSYLDKMEFSESDIYNYYRWYGYSLAASGKDSESIEIYMKGYEWFPGREKGADFLYFAADMARLGGDYQKTEKLFSLIMRSYPDFGKRNVVAFLLFWIEYRQGKYEQAMRTLLKIKAENGVASYSFRRAWYWEARVNEKLERYDRAYEQFIKIVEKHPATLYGTLAASRLRFRNIGYSKEKEEQSLSRIFFSKNSSIMGITWWLMGFHVSKNYEMLRNLATVYKSAIFDRGGEQDRIFVSFAVKKAGLFSYSANLLKTAISFSEKTRDYVRLQYPVAFEEEILSHAHFYGVDPLFVFSIARQESLFTKDAVSRSYAIGLLQILPTTAQLLANQEGYGKIIPANLKKPLTNVRFGIKFLSFLIKRFDGYIPLAAAGYNAGPGKIYRWINRNPQFELDEYIEDIPIFQTRNYVKKVMKNYAVYNYLFRGEVYDQYDFELPGT